MRSAGHKGEPEGALAAKRSQLGWQVVGNEARVGRVRKVIAILASSARGNTVAAPARHSISQFMERIHRY